MIPAPQVSIVMAVYDAERYLREAVDSVLAQTLTDLELVIVDDGSTDRSSDILATYTDPRVRVLRQPVNRGLPAALNIGWRAARAPLIARLDADDVAEPTRLARQVAVMRATPGLDVLGTWTLEIDEHGQPIGEFTFPPSEPAIRWGMTVTNVVYHPTVIMRRERLERLGGYDPTAVWAEDYDLFTRVLADGGRIGVLPERLVRYRRSPHQISRTRVEEQRRSAATVRRRYIAALVGETPDADLSEAVAHLQRPAGAPLPPGILGDALVLARRIRTRSRNGTGRAAAEAGEVDRLARRALLHHAARLREEGRRRDAWRVWREALRCGADDRRRREAWPEAARLLAASLRAAWIPVLVFATWLAGVVMTVAHHEFWRDEVRALSLTRTADSPLALLRAITDEGHPPAWYLLLSIGRLAGDSPQILPIVSVTVAAAAAALFLWRAPFPPWLRVVVIFGALPFYEYAVMARNYGISMLALFAFAALHPRRRAHPGALAVSLAVLANTNAHSVLFAVLLAAVWMWGVVDERGDATAGAVVRAHAGPLAIVALGIALAVVVAYPRPDTIVTAARSLTAADVARSAMHTAFWPAEHFRALIPDVRGPLDQALLYVAIAGLVARPVLALAALAAMLGLGVFFDLVYVGAYRHQGLLLVFLLTTYWLLREGRVARVPSRARRVAAAVGLYGAVLPMLLMTLLDMPRLVTRDIRRPLTASPALAAWLERSATHRDAVLVAEPAFLLESLPYYADNPIFLPREQRTGATSSFTTGTRRTLSLAELLDTAEDVRRASTRPVLLVLGYWDLATNPRRERRLSYGMTFTWTPEALARLERTAERVAEFGDAEGDERFLVYRLR